MVVLYEVGGSIRDELLGSSSNDLDFVAICPEGWEALLAWANQFLDIIFLVKPEFLTIRGSKNNIVYDFVMARKEGVYNDGRRPDLVEPGTLLDDLSRRDFTCNAIARQIGTTNLIDPFNGQEDLKHRLLRTVGDPVQRFSEDHLRIVRALRFSLTKDLQWAKSLTDAIFDQSWHNCLSSLPVERRIGELSKMFRHDSVAAMARLSALPSYMQSELFEGLWLLPTNRK